MNPRSKYPFGPGGPTPGKPLEPDEFLVLLTTGGPAVRITGSLTAGRPSNPRLECQDWFTPWEAVPTSTSEDAAMVKFCSYFFQEKVLTPCAQVLLLRSINSYQ